MNVCITGGAGYTGVMLARALQNKCKVKVFDSFLFKNHKVFDGTHIKAIAGDIRNAEADQDLWKEVDTLVHLAFVSNDPGRGTDLKVAEAINRKGFCKTLEAFVRSSRSIHKHVVFPSSSSIYGSRPGSEICTEDTEPGPISAYAKDKVFCENYLKFMSVKEGFSYSILRPATVHGCSLKNRFDLLINGMILQALDGKTILIRNPECLRPSVYILDLVAIYEKVILDRAGIFKNETWNVAFHPQTSIDIYNTIQKLMDRELQSEIISHSDTRSYNVSSNKIMQTDCIKQPRTIEETFLKLRDSYDAGCINSADPYLFNNLVDVI